MGGRRKGSAANDASPTRPTSARPMHARETCGTAGMGGPSTPSDSGPIMTGSRRCTSIDFNERDWIEDDIHIWDAMDIDALGWDADLKAVESKRVTRSASESRLTKAQPNPSLRYWRMCCWPIAGKQGLPGGQRGQAPRPSREYDAPPRRWHHDWDGAQSGRGDQTSCFRPGAPHFRVSAPRERIDAHVRANLRETPPSSVVMP